MDRYGRALTSSGAARPTEMSWFRDIPSATMPQFQYRSLASAADRLPAPRPRNGRENNSAWESKPRSAAEPRSPLVSLPKPPLSVAPALPTFRVSRQGKSRSAIPWPILVPASSCGVIGHTEAALLNMINDQGGIAGRKINFISLDDSYGSLKTVAASAGWSKRTRLPSASRTSAHPATRPSRRR